MAYTNSLLFTGRSEGFIAMSQNAPLESNPETGASFTTCANCHSPMPSELRFCRNCGYRLGEGSAEYTQTVRFQDGTYLPPVANRANGFAGSCGQMASVGSGAIRRRKRFGGMSWIFLAVIMFFVIGGVASHFAPPFHRGGGSFGISAPPRSYFGVDGFENTDGGVTFGDAEPPG